MKQFLITPASGKRLIARALTSHEVIKKTLKSNTLIIIAGTTNGYVAEEILSKINQLDVFSREKFIRGVVLPPGQPITETGRLPGEDEFPGDVVIDRGKWKKGLTIFDVVDDLKEGDVVLKGANALDMSRGQAGVLIGDPHGGTIGTVMNAVVGRRVRLIHPVGLEKRVDQGLNKIARVLNAPGARGPRLLPTPGEVFTEIEAISILSGAEAQLIASGGVNGAEGSIWLAVSGADNQVKETDYLLNSISEEPPFNII
ncbi:MAG: hypothetical protein LUQ24_06440 [Methanobacterium sp.]|nr:hypothetical protein [Methanobacterium sp.]